MTGIYETVHFECAAVNRQCHILSVNGHWWSFLVDSGHFTLLMKTRSHFFTSLACARKGSHGRFFAVAPNHIL